MIDADWIHDVETNNSFALQGHDQELPLYIFNDTWASVYFYIRCLVSSVIKFYKKDKEKLMF